MTHYHTAFLTSQSTEPQNCPISIWTAQKLWNIWTRCIYGWLHIAVYSIKYFEKMMLIQLFSEEGYDIHDWWKFLSQLMETSSTNFQWIFTFLQGNIWKKEVPVRMSICIKLGSLLDVKKKKNTGVGCHDLIQGIFPIQGSNPRLLCLLYWQPGSSPLAPLEKWLVQGKPCFYHLNKITIENTPRCSRNHYFCSVPLGFSYLWSKPHFSLLEFVPANSISEYVGIMYLNSNGFKGGYFNFLLEYNFFTRLC